MPRSSDRAIGARALFVCPFVTLAFLVSSSGAETPVSGTISTTTWTKAASPYRVTGAITVPAGETLTVAPGVDVLFDAYVPFTVQGKLLAVGTETDSIRFLKGTANWGGIRFTGTDSSAIAYARISHAISSEGLYYTLAVTDARLSIANSVISRNTMNTFNITGSAAFVTVTRSMIIDNPGYVALFYEGADATFEDCRIARNGHVMELHGDGIRVRCVRSAIVDNSGTVVFAMHYSTDGEGMVLDFQDCTIAGNSFGLVIENNVYLTVANSILRNDASDEIGLGMGLQTTAQIAVRWSNIKGTEIFPGGGNINADPLFVDAANGDYRLAPGSPCIDAGNPSLLDADGSRADMGYTGGDGGPSTAGTPVSGTISSATWTAAASPYRVTGAIDVPAGGTLTIEPGVDVIFDADVPLTVEGTLHAAGTVDGPIRFLPAMSLWWGGIRFGGAGSSEMTDAVVTGARGARGGGISLIGTETDRPHLTMRRCSVAGNHAAAGPAGGFFAKYATVDIAGCTFSQNTATRSPGGVSLHFSTATIDSSVLTANRPFSSAGYAGDDVSGEVRAEGFFADRSTVDLTRVLVADNGSQEGGWGGGDKIGALILSDCDARLVNCTVIPSLIQAINVVNGIASPPPVSIVNTISGWRTASTRVSGTGFVQKTRNGAAPGPVTIAFSDIEVNTDWGEPAPPGTGYISVYPRFAGTDAGGYVVTGDYRLLADSPCIDAGDPAVLDLDGSRSDMGWTGGGGTTLPRILAEIPEIVFGPARAETLVIRNTGWADLVLTDLALPDSFSTTCVFPDTIAAGDSLAVPIAYLGEIARTDTGYVASTDPINPALAIVLRAYGPTAMTPTAGPLAFSLFPNVPNPFNPTTAIRFSLAAPGETKLAIYDVSGRHVRTLVSGPLPAGAHEVAWDGRDASGRPCASGIYAYRLASAEGVLIRRMALVR